MKATPADPVQLPHETDLALQARLVAALRRTLGGDVRVLETHISYVLLTGQYAYKIKKAVDLGFLDFRALSSRLFYCQEELRLNRRTAPGIYLDVVAIAGSIDAPAMGGDGQPIEYALKMREFRQDALAIHALERGEMSEACVDSLATQLADMHAAAKAADSGGSHGDPDVVLRFALRNFERMRPAVADLQDAGHLDGLRAWTQAEHAAMAAALRDRRRRARIRECHGDLHLGNIAVIDDQPVIFDCLEFSEDLRWTDVMSDVAFLVMDFRHRGRRDLAHRFLNAYLEITGDYDGMRVLRFHLVYRAMVRAMVACERARQLAPGPAGAAALAESRRYVDLAGRFAYDWQPAIVITHGYSGCGKTTASQALVEAVAGVRIRTDVERKRLHGLRPTDRDPAGLDASMYSAEVARWVYLRVLALARAAAEAGFAAVVDGAFLWRWQRELFRDLARELDVPFLVVTFKAREATLRERIVRRMQNAHDASDADLAVLDQQLRTAHPLEADEDTDTIVIDTEKPITVGQWRAVSERLARPIKRRRAEEANVSSLSHAG